MQEFPAFQTQIYEPYQASDVIVLGLSQEDFAAVDGFGQENGITFPLLLHNSSVNPYGVPLEGSIAVEVVLDREGKVAFAGQSSTADSILGIIQQHL